MWKYMGVKINLTKRQRQNAKCPQTRHVTCHVYIITVHVGVGQGGTALQDFEKATPRYPTKTVLLLENMEVKRILKGTQKQKRAI